MARRNLLHDVRPYALTICKQGANRKRIYLRKEKEGTSPDVTSPAPHRILKSDWDTFYCVVAEPGWEEDPGQTGTLPDMWASEDEIRKAAHHFAQSDMLVNAFHDSMEPYGTVVENFIAQTDMNVEGETIRKGSWVVGIQPSDDGRRAIEHGEFTGISLEGDGLRTLTGDDDRTLLQKVGQLLTGTASTVTVNNANAIPQSRGNLEATENEEDGNVASDEQIRKIEENQEELRKAQGATQTAIEGLLGNVNTLSDKLEAALKRRADEEEPASEKLKKSLDALTENVEDIKNGIDALAEGGSVQDTHSDTTPVRKSDNPLAGILD